MASRSMQELIDSALDELKSRDWDEDSILEIASYFVPVYTYDLLKLAEDDLWLMHAESEYGSTTADKCISEAVAQQIEEALFEALVAERNREPSEADSGTEEDEDDGITGNPCSHCEGPHQDDWEREEIHDATEVQE